MSLVTNLKVWPLAVCSAALLFVGCSGGLPSLSPDGYVVEPSYLGQFTRGGSKSTLWYRGSDEHYHYFYHSMKVKTNYRVRREALMLDPDDEFALDSQKEVFLGPTVNRLLREQASGGDANIKR